MVFFIKKSCTFTKYWIHSFIVQAIERKKSNLLLNGISKLPKCHVFFFKSYKTLFNPGWACSRSILVLGEGTSPHLSVSQLAASATSTLKTFSPTGPLWARLVCKSLCRSVVCCPLPMQFFSMPLIGHQIT